MNYYQKQRIAGAVYIFAGCLLVIWASSILFKILIFIVGLLLINSGLKMVGQRSLWSHGSNYFFRSRFFGQF